jgi:C4-type Zn-finger protein
MSEQMIHEQAQTALTNLNCTHPATAITGLEGVLARLDPNTQDAAVFRRAIDWLEEISQSITGVEEDLLASANFTFEHTDSRIAKLEEKLAASTSSFEIEVFKHAIYLTETIPGEHPDSMITEVEAALERIGPDSPDAEVFRRAINRLEEIAHEITEVEDLLCEANFSFGKIEA